MKYAKELAEKLKNYSITIRNKCLSYKKWKKMIKNRPEYIIEKWQKLLNKDCLKTERLFKHSCYSCNKTLDKSLEDELSIINSNTLYKICKRLQKLTNVNALEYLNSVIQSHKYTFTRCSTHTLI